MIHMPKQCIYSKYVCSFLWKIPNSYRDHIESFQPFLSRITVLHSQKWKLRTEFCFFSPPHLPPRSFDNQDGTWWWEGNWYNIWNTVPDIRLWYNIWKTVLDIWLCCIPLNYRTFKASAPWWCKFPLVEGRAYFSTCFNIFAPSHLQSWYVSRNKG